MDSPPSEARTRIAQSVRDACLRAAVDAYEDAGVRGLCAEGRWECAVDAIRRVELSQLIASEPPAAGE